MIKAIKTIYKNQEFRSKLEAEYAKGFDISGVKYIYEPEGFEFEDGTKYLPDFYLPDYDCFVEVKGIMSEKDEHKINMLRRESGKKVIIATGDRIFIGEKRAELEPFSFDESYFNDEKVHEKEKLVQVSNAEYSAFFEMIYSKGDNGAKPIVDLSGHDSPFFMICPKCGKKTLHDSCDGWSCGWCGHYDGDKFDLILIDSFDKECEIVEVFPSYINYRDKYGFLKRG